MEVSQAAHALKQAIELDNGTGETVALAVQRLAEQVGGQLDMRQLSPDKAALYLVALMLARE